MLDAAVFTIMHESKAKESKEYDSTEERVHKAQPECVEFLLFSGGECFTSDCSEDLIDLCVTESVKEWCEDGVTMVLQWCEDGVTMMVQ
jgi:hypothetical protein